MSALAFFIDSSRCIGCKACVQACEECDTHRGVSMIHLETIQRSGSVQTAPQVCMHCEEPICAEVCPADAIKKTDDGVVQSSLKPRCIGCSNCVLACPFGVPRYLVSIDQMMKCDLCYDRTSVDKKPMCATVCPSQALTFTTLGSTLLATASGVIAAVGRWGRREAKTPGMRVVSASSVPLGGSALFRYPTSGDPCILVRGQDGSLRAFSQVCTHLSCAVVHRPERDELFCPCHHGIFSAIDGRPIAGPPIRRLPMIQVELRGDDVIAIGKEAS